MHLLGLEGCL